MALIDSELYRNIRRSDFESMGWNGPEKAIKAPGITRTINTFNQIALWVSHEVLETTQTTVRIQKISRFIDIAKQLVEINDLNGAKTIVSGLDHSPVHRLEKTWAVC